MKNTYFKLLAEQGPAASETHGVWADCEGLAGSGQDSVTVTSANRVIQVAVLRMGWLGQGWGQADQGAGWQQSRQEKAGPGNAENQTGAEEAKRAGFGD